MKTDKLYKYANKKLKENNYLYFKNTFKEYLICFKTDKIYYIMFHDSAILDHHLFGSLMGKDNKLDIMSKVEKFKKIGLRKCFIERDGFDKSDVSFLSAESAYLLKDLIKHSDITEYKELTAEKFFSELEILWEEELLKDIIK